MINLYNILIHKISHRIDENKIKSYLAKEGRFAAKLSKQDNNSKLNRLLSIVQNQAVSLSDKIWIQENACIRDDKESGYPLLYSSTPLNQVGRVNAFLSEYNRRLDHEGILVCWFETSSACKMKIYARYPLLIANIINFKNFIWHRVFPKMPLLKKIYWVVTKGKNRLFPRSEILGRMFYNGYRVISEKPVGGKHYVIAKKIQEPLKDSNPSYGPVIKLRRIGKNGKLVDIYKFRTMHAYSEYLQPYIYENNRLEKGGKFANDYRVSTLGRFMRKFWLDELPMFINLIKGDIKIVGVRPLSRQYFDLYSSELKELRIKTKPGLLPPYYADMPRTLDEIQESEMRYINQYLKNPLLTDCKYLYKILYNILIKRERSK